MTQKPIAAGLFTWPLPAPPASPRLIGGRCPECTATTFPFTAGCPRCGDDHMQPEELPYRGGLYTWTTQEFLPKLPYRGPETPKDFEPWAVGYVQLGDQLRVEGRLYDVALDELDFDMQFEVVVRPFRIDDDGTEVFTFGFAPAANR